MEKSIQSPQYAVFVKKLTEIREKAGLTQQELARKLRTSQSNVAHIEIGQRRVDFLEFVRICEACGADPIKVATEVVKGMRTARRRGRRR